MINHIINNIINYIPFLSHFITLSLFFYDYLIFFMIISFFFMIISLNLRIRFIIFKHHLRTTTRTNHRLHTDSFESYLLYSYIMASHAPLITIPVMEKIEHFVDYIPVNVTATHGGADDLVKKITDLIFPPTEEITQQTPPDLASVPSKKRGRPKGSKNKPKDDIPADVPAEPKKRGRPKGSSNKPKDDIPADVPAEPKKRGRPKGSKNKPKDDIPDEPKKRGRPSKHGHIVKTTPTARTCSVCGQAGHNKRSCPMC